jgi:CheY-like chemotaxis protein
MNLPAYLPQQVATQVTETAPTQFKIFIVDDEEMTRETLCAMLDEPRYILQTASNGCDGLVKATAFAPDLIILDIELHDEMNGIEVCRQLKQMPQTADVPIIFVTGRSDLLPPAFAAGGADYINKPVHLQELRARVSSQLKIRQLMMTLRIMNDYYEERVNQLEYALVV